jgi:hypothetical protein
MMPASDPWSLATLITLSGGVGRIRVWPREHRDPLEGISARQLVDIIKELGGNPAELLGGYATSLAIDTDPDMSEPPRAGEAQDTTSIERHREFPPEVPGIRPPGDDELTDLKHGPEEDFEDVENGDLAELSNNQRSITYVRTYPDGTREVIFFEY